MHKPNKQVIETTKTVIIAVLVTAVIAFVAGNSYANGRQAEVRNAVEQATAQAKK